jgi:hypothetical protein
VLVIDWIAFCAHATIGMHDNAPSATSAAGHLRHLPMLAIS